MNRDFIKNIEIIKQAIADNKLVIFAGAGISIDAGVPLWKDVINSLKKDIVIPEYETDYLRIVQMYFNERGQKEYTESIRKILNHKKIRHNDIHEAIFELNPSCILTTNFDNLLEQVIQSKAYPFSTITKDTTFPYAKNTKLLVKVHGDLDDGNLVLKEDDYLEYSYNHPLIESFIKNAFATKVVLFVGYSFSDFDLKLILQNVRKILGQDFQNAYLIDTSEQYHPAQRKYLREKGVVVINYNDGQYVGLQGEERNFIDDFLFHKKNYLEQTYSLKYNGVNSDTGKRLLRILTFIGKYDTFYESISELNIVSKMYESLKRFDEVFSIPPAFLSNLYPFSISKSYEKNYEYYNLASSNEDVSQFFFDYFDAETKEINDSFFSDNNVTEAKETIKQQLDYVLHKLGFSLIFNTTRHQITDDHYSASEEKKNIIQSKKIENNCNCLLCVFKKFDFSELFLQLKTSNIIETSNLRDDLLLAYTNYKVGNFIAAYNQFEEIANKSWQIGKYVTYFICKTNQKYLRNLIKAHEGSLNNKNNDYVDTVIRKIDEIDLDKLLYEIPQLNKDIYELLKIIRDDTVLTNVNKEINLFSEKIIDTYKLYKKDGAAFGQSYYAYALLELSKAHTFYTYNCILSDVFDNFLKTINKGIASVFISYATDDEYTGKIREFSSKLLELIVFYSDPVFLNDIFREYKIKKIEIEEEEIRDFLKFVNNLFSSFYTDGFFDIIPTTETTENNFFFKQNIDKYICNILCLLSRLDLQKENSKELITNFLNFLYINNSFINYSDLKHVNRFIATNSHLFDYPQFIKLLELAANSEILLSDEDYIRILCGALEKYFPNEVLQSENLANIIIQKSITPLKGRATNRFIFLFKISNSESKNKIQNATRELLNAQFNPDLFFEGVRINIIDFDEYKTEITETIEKNISNDIKWKNDEPKLTSFHAYNLASNIYDLKIPFETFNLPENTPQYWKFVFNPLAFDYSKFNPMWLLTIHNKHIMEVFSNIPEIKTSLENSLKNKYHEELSNIYAKFFLRQASVNI